MAATDERAIHEFPTGTIDDNSLLIMDRPTSTPGEYETEKFAIANLGLKLLGGIDFPSNLDTDEQDIFGAINEVNAKAMNIAAEYDDTASYSKGDYCIYQNAAYRCVKASGTTTGTFVAADWTRIKVLEEVKTNSEEIDLKQDALTVEDISSGITFTNFTNMTSVTVLGAKKYGKIVDLWLQPKFTRSTPGINYGCTVNFTNNNNRPLLIATTSAFQGSEFWLSNFQNDGWLFLREITGGSGEYTPYLRFIYICN